MSTPDPLTKRALDALIALLGLHPDGEDTFRGDARDLGWGQLFGGQVLGQSLSAAVQTVPADRHVHSLHGYFLRPGRVDAPIEYRVDRSRDGRSFTTRRVAAHQAGEQIFVMAASFQVDEAGFDHQDDMPDAPAPESLRSERELAEMVADRIPAPLQKIALGPRPIELRPVDPVNPMKPRVGPPRAMVWYRAAGRLPDDPALHRYLLAYGSDFQFLSTSMRPHGVSWLTPGMQVASLDHAMWFHRPFRMDEWLLHVVESPSASGGRGLVRGRFYSRDGKLVATTAQEGLIRNRSAR